jgi:hypothetical protein
VILTLLILLSLIKQMLMLLSWKSQWRIKVLNLSFNKAEKIAGFTGKLM